MPEYLAPGVYLEEVSFRSKSIEGVSTTTTGFIGPTRSGPLHLVPDVITSLADFEHIYGDRMPLAFGSPSDGTTTDRDNFLWHAVRAFFEEGGLRLYIVRTFRRLDDKEYTYPPDSFDKATKSASFFDDHGHAMYNDGHARASLPDGSGDTGLHIRARFPGTQGGIQVRFTINIGQNVLSLDRLTNQPRVNGLLNYDIVWIKNAGVDASAHDAFGGGAFHVAQSFIDPVTMTPTWRFQSTLHSPIHMVDLAHLDPAKDSVRVVTLSVTAFPGDPNSLPFVWSNISPDPNHTRNGQPDSLFNIFANEPTSDEMARTMPIVLEAGKQVTSGLDVLQALFDASPLPTSPISRLSLKDALADFVSDDAVTRSKATDLNRSIDILLIGGNDGLLPGANEYEGKAEEDRVFKTGLKAFEDVEGISILAAPGSTYDYVNNEAESESIIGLLLAHAARNYQIVVLDSGNGMTIAEVRAQRSKLDSTYGALYYPWVRIEDPVTRTQKYMPPSGFVAGIYARNDTQRGVYKAPANEVVNLSIGFEKTINKAQQDVLNVEGINCFRFFEGRGYRLWGARTISSDQEWKYVNLRRYFNYLELSLYRGTQWVVFEPNGDQLWFKVRRTITDFLTSEWENGALLGEKAEQAFFVRCDRSTMNQNDLDNGRLVCLVGVAPLRPAEYVIIRIGQWTGSSK